MRENIFTLDLSIIRQFPATLVFGAEKPPPHRMRVIFIHRIYPFREISSNFGFCGRKAPPPRMREILLHRIYPFQAISSNCWFLWQKAPSPSGWEKFFYTGSIHFRQFPATLVFVAEKSSSPRMRVIIFTLDLSISDYCQQLWFLWQKSPSP